MFSEVFTSRMLTCWHENILTNRSHPSLSKTSLNHSYALLYHSAPHTRVWESQGSLQGPRGWPVVSSITTALCGFPPWASLFSLPRLWAMGPHWGGKRKEKEARGIQDKHIHLHPILPKATLSLSKHAWINKSYSQEFCFLDLHAWVPGRKTAINYYS